MQFEYKARSQNDGIRQGVIEAPDRPAAIQRLKAEGCHPFSLEAKVFAVASSHQAMLSGGSWSFPWQKKVTRREMEAFTEHLAELVEAGITVPLSIQRIRSQCRSKPMLEVLTEVHRSVVGGDSLSVSLSQFPDIFPELYVRLIQVGEHSSALEEVLRSWVEKSRKTRELVDRVRAALIYPVVMLTVGFLTVWGLLVFIFPRLLGLFQTLGGTLPLPTRILLSLSFMLSGKGFWLTLAACALVFVYFRGSDRRDLVRQQWEDWSTRIPFYGRIRRWSCEAQMADNLELLVRQGIPLSSAIEMLEATSQRSYREKLSTINKEVIGGETFSTAAGRHSLFLPEMIDLLAVAEQTGSLEEAFAKITLFYERRLDRDLKVFMSLLEPSLILIMGGVVAFIVAAMLLPIFQINLLI